MILNNIYENDITVETSRAYKLSKDTIQGFIDNKEALQQAIYKLLNTEKYEYPVYGFDYGIEFQNLIGTDPVYVRIELKRRIKECLLRDDRIHSVDNFSFTNTDNIITCTFDVRSIFGNTTITKEVNF